MKLYVGNLSYNTTEQDLINLFATIGEVKEAKLIVDRDSGRSKGFAFIEMASKQDGEKAIGQLNETEVGGREIKVNEAHSKPGRGGSRSR